MAVMSLTCAEGELKIEQTTPEWWRCWFETEIQVAYLGAEGPRYLLPRLLSAVRRMIGQDSEYRPVDSFEWILSLAEAHSSLYLGRTEAGIELIWQDAEARTIGRMRPSGDRLLEWERELSGAL